jgi:hypothetical protein
MANSTVGITPAREHQRVQNTARQANGGAAPLRRGIAQELQK